MKIIPREPENQPMTASIIRFVGYIEFFAVFFIVFSLLSSVVPPLAFIIAMIAGTSVSIIAFVLSRIISDLHAVRINTNGYETEYEREDYRLLVQSMRKMNKNLERILKMFYALHPDIFESIDDGDESDESDESDEYDPDIMFETDQEKRDKELLEEIKMY